MSVVPIPGTTNISHDMENIDGEGVPFSSEEMAELEEIGDVVEGDRTNERYMMNSIESQL